MTKPLENHQQLLARIDRLQLDRKSLIEHCAVMGADLSDYIDCVDRSTESFIALPDHLQELINEASEVYDNERS